MFLKSLLISTSTSVIRNIKFRKGINLIIDESEGKVTGNSVGKTTVLKLIDYCFGADKKIIWEDPENKKQDYTLVKDFLIQNGVVVTLTLTESLDDPKAREIVIERNFISRGKKVIRRVAGRAILDEELDDALKREFFPTHAAEKPTFRQIISHNVRYEDLSLVNTLRTLDRFTSDAEYETLHLFLFGCDFQRGNVKQQIIESIRQEDNFKKRLEKQQTRSGYEATLALIENEIAALLEKKLALNINVNFEKDLERLNRVKYEINRISSKIGKLNIRKGIILESRSELEQSQTNIDLQQLRNLYSQASKNLDRIQKTFEELVVFHNLMLSEKGKFIANELPQLEIELSEMNSSLKNLLKEESDLTSSIARSDTYEELEGLIVALNKKYELKGEVENTVEQLKVVDENLKGLNEKLNIIDEELFSDEFEQKVKHQLNKFNKHFAAISEALYNEQYALKYAIINNKKGQKLYKFSPFAPFGPNVATGKKQGEISSFDIAYTLFSDEEGLSCMHFVLNDKKELMHDNQLVKIAELVQHNNVQFVASILKDKLPKELNNEDNFIIKLSESSKLFRIEG